MSPQVDRLLLFEIVIAGCFAAVIFGLVLVFAVRYRRRADSERPLPIAGDLRLELLWTFVPLGLTLVMFGWGAQLYFEERQPPGQVREITVVAKQWMWKFQQPTGQREIDTLHVPVGRPILLRMTSEDVIHSLFVPAFRVKQDVLPGRYTTLWFEATQPGRYHLFCTQYCGAAHAGMIGWVEALAPAEFEAWLGGRTTAVENPATRGQKLFERSGCATCHVAGAPARAPRLQGVYGKTVKLVTGQAVVADDNYLRESILTPQAKIVAGYGPVMPTYTGQLSEEDVLDLIAYLKSLTPPAEESRP